MVSLVNPASSTAVATLLAPLHACAAQPGRLALAGPDTVAGTGRQRQLACFHFNGPDAGHDPIRLGLFAGIHGDEPAGSAALVHFLLGLASEPDRAAGYQLWVYPVINPTGYVAGRRESASGKDLNREFWRGTAEPEVQEIEAELLARRFDGIVTLHADDTCEGLYGYAHGRSLDEMLLGPALTAAAVLLPRDTRAVIDGFSARAGLIGDCFEGILSPPPAQHPRPFNLIFETPARAPLGAQVAANVAALDTILANYRGFIAHAQYL